VLQSAVQQQLLLLLLLLPARGKVKSHDIPYAVSRVFRALGTVKKFENV
jgi:hypothetical protein